MKHPRRWNVTIPMIGLQKWLHTQNSHQKWWTPEIYLGTQKKKILSVWRAVTLRQNLQVKLAVSQSQYADTGLTSSRSDRITPGAWQDSHQRTMFQVTCMTWWRKKRKGFPDLPLSRPPRWLKIERNILAVRGVSWPNLVSADCLIDISIMDPGNESCSACWPAGHLAWQKLVTLDITRKLFNHFLMLPMSVGTIDFYHFIPLSLTLTSTGGRKVSAKQNLLALFSRTLFDCSTWNLIWCESNLSWTSRYDFV